MGGRVGGSDAALNAAASGWERLSRGERVVLGPCGFGQLPNRDGLGGGGAVARTRRAGGARAGAGSGATAAETGGVVATLAPWAALNGPRRVETGSLAG